MTTWSRGASLFTVLTLGWTVLGSSQTPTPAGSVRESVRVNIINVEVQVTDRSGKPVAGLGAADFQLFEDDKPVQITNFYVGDGFAALATPAPGSAGEVAAPTPAGAPSATTPTPAPPSAAGDSQALHLVVLVDGVNIDNTSRNVAIDAIASAIESRLRPGDDVMVASFDRAMRIRCPLTTNLQGAATALRDIKKDSSEGQHFGSDRINLLDRLSSVAARTPEDAKSIRDEKELDAEVAAERLWVLEGRMFTAMGQLVDSLAGLEGRKALLFVSEGIPSQAGRALFDELQARYPGQIPTDIERTRFDLSDRFWTLGMRANAGRVTFYPVDARLYRGMPAANAETIEPAYDISAAALDSVDRSLSLLGFAKATGGQVMVSTVRLDEQLGSAIDSLDAFYSLGFSPGHSGDGKYHRLTVKVKGSGLSVRTREGYLDKPDSARQADRTAAALLRGGRTNTMGLEADTGHVVREGRKTLKVPLTVSLPGSALTLLPTADGMAGKVSFSIAGKDMEGRHSEPHREEFAIPVPSDKVEAFKQQRLVFAFEVVLHEGEYALAVTAHDEVGQTEATVTLGITAAAPPKT